MYIYYTLSCTALNQTLPPPLYNFLIYFLWEILIIIKMHIFPYLLRCKFENVGQRVISLVGGSKSCTVS